MIPKIIHYCWFGKGIMPQSQKECIKSWKKLMPDYKIIRWDESNFDINKFSASKFAYQEKKYALVSDVCRYNVLYEYGGIYLDTDVKVFKRFDEFLDANFFSAIELYNEFFTENIREMLNEEGTPKVVGIDIPRLEILTSTIGCVPGSVLIGELRDFYNSIDANEEFARNYRDYVNNDRLVARFATKYGFRYVDKLQHLDGNMVIYPTGIFGHAFCPNKDFEVSFHYNAASWEDNVSSTTIRRRKLDKYHLLKLHDRLVKIKKQLLKK
jgi:hypothetical protein